jgi:hypothetical protein
MTMIARELAVPVRIIVTGGYTLGVGRRPGR